MSIRLNCLLRLQLDRPDLPLMIPEKVFQCPEQFGLKRPSGASDKSLLCEGCPFQGDLARRVKVLST